MTEKLVIKMIDDKEKAKKLQALIDENDGYCPCAVEQTEDTQCLCTEFMKSTNEGPCRCGLYERKLLMIDD